MRPLLPTLLAASANSPSSRASSAACTRRARRSSRGTSPAAGCRTTSASWPAYADYVALLYRTNSIVEHTQIWWSVRPHLGFGTVEVRIMDAQSRADESTALLALATACVAQAALDYDAGRVPAPVPQRLIEENMWRAIRYGMDGKLIDFAGELEIPRGRRSSACWSGPAGPRALGLDAHLSGLERMLSSGNGAQRQWRRHEAGERMEDIYAAQRGRDLGDLRGGGHRAAGHPEGRDVSTKITTTRTTRGHEQRATSTSEEEIRARLEEELRRITVRDVLLQTPSGWSTSAASGSG